MISKKVPNILKVSPEIVDFNKRMGYCHTNSLKISHAFSNEDTRVVTGFIDGSLDGTAFLHSWVELTASKTQEQKVIDFNYNAIFDRDYYYALQNVYPLTVITREKIKRFLDANINPERLAGISDKELVLFFDDILQILEEEKANEQAVQKQ